MSKTPLATKTFEIKIEARFPEHGEFEDELVRRINEVISSEYMKGGDDLMGYEGPWVKRVQTSIIREEGITP